MESDKNKMDEFLKNRLNNFDGSDDDWDLPSERPWKNAREGFPRHPKKSRIDSSFIALIFLGLSLIAAGGFIYFQQKNITELKSNFVVAEAKIDSSKNAFQTLEKQLIELTTDFSKRETEFNIEKEEAILKIQFLEKREKMFLSDCSAKAGETDDLRREITILQDQLIEFETEQEKLLVIISEKDKLITKLSPENQLKPLASISKLPSPVLETKASVFSQNSTPAIAKIKRKRRRKKWEIGLSFSSSEYQVPIAYRFSKFNPVAENDIVQIIETNGAGLNLGYELKRNLFLKTGLQLRGGGIQREISSTLYYDKSGEYINTSGEVSNDLLLETNSALGTSENRLAFEIPQGTDIIDGDLVVTKLTNLEALAFVKIPIGVDYYIGKKRLQWWLRGGIALNAAATLDVLAEGTLDYDNKEIPVEIEPIATPAIVNAFFSGYAGLGFNYRFARKWHFRGSFSEEFNLAASSFLQPATVLNFDNQSFEFGFHYRF